jgi:hypothetical protein
MLVKEPEQRLGCTAEGISAIKSHPFFSSIDWSLLEKKMLQPLLVPQEHKSDPPGFIVNSLLVESLGKRFN